MKFKKYKKEKDDTGLFIPAGIFIGIGIGMIFDQIPGGILLGLGLGFLAMAIAKNKK